MGSIHGLLLLLALVGSCIFVESRSLEILGTIEDYKHASRSKLYPTATKEQKISEVVASVNQQVCLLCERVVGDTKSFLTSNETQTTVSDALHEACSLLQPFEGECVSLLDEYLPLIFAEISSVQPEELCESVALCNSSALLSKKDTPCSLCRELADEILVKFSDPDTQLEIIQALIKGCTKLQGFAQQCKRLVFLYGPTVLTTVEKLLETNDLCAAIQVCKAAIEGSVASPGVIAAA